MSDRERSSDDEATRPAAAPKVESTTADLPSPDSRATVQVGDLIGRYVLLAELGRGGMGAVFAGHDHDLDRRVAIKFVSVPDPTMTEKFLAEARATARCTHPNIVGVHEIGRYRDQPYLVLEYLSGVSLAQLLRGPRLSVARVIAIMTSVARALACAHSHGIVHRDLTASNVMVLGDDHVKVLDFGIAAYAQANAGHDDGDRTTGRRGNRHPGTLPYMSPEQLLGGRLDGRTDLWSFGVLLYELLTGARPFVADDDDALRAAILKDGVPTPLDQVRPDLPRELVRLTERCLERSRARRCGSADELIATLEALAERGGRELSRWLAAGPLPAEADRVAVGLVEALAAHTDARPIDPARTRVWPDGRVELIAREAEPEVAAADNLAAVGQLADRVIEAANGSRTPQQHRRAQRMRRALSTTQHPIATRRPSAHHLARQLAAARAPRRLWPAVATGLALAAAAALGLVVYARARASGAAAIIAPSFSPQLERLDASMARLREAREPAAARALFERFVTDPANARLATDAWLRRHATELAAHDYEAALASAGAAYLAAADPGASQRALAALIEVQIAQRRWSEVGEAVASDELEPGVRERVTAAVAIATRHQPPRGLARSDSDAIAQRLLVGEPSPGAPTVATAIDLDGDGRDEVVSVEAGEVRAWRPDGTPLWQRPLRVGGLRAICGDRDARGAWLAIASNGSSDLLAADAHGATLVTEADGGHACALGDLDGDGAVELYLKVDTRLSRHRAEVDGTWRVDRWDVGSVIYGLAATDLDLDGRDELAMSLGEWQAYDVRVLSGATLTTVDRLRLGRVTRLEVVRQGPGRAPLLLAAKDGMWPSAVFLPADRPSGVADGYYTLRLDEGRLAVRGHVGSEQTGVFGTFAVGDLDGDGRDEAIATEFVRARPFATLLHVDASGSLTGTVIEDTQILTLGRFGRDGKVEALARLWSGATVASWWLGRGGAPVPPIEPSAPLTVAGPPTGLGADLAQTWRRATELTRFGATATALATFEQLAAVAPVTAQSSALTQALVLRRHRGEPLGALYSSLAASEAPGSPSQLAQLLAAVTTSVDEGDLVGALQVIDAALASPALDNAARDQLVATRARVDAVEAELYAGRVLSTQWTILDPIGVRRDPIARSLVLDGFGARPLAALELTRGQGPVTVTIVGTVTRAEWAAGITFALRPLDVDAKPLQMMVHTAGGGGIYRLHVNPALAEHALGNRIEPNVDFTLRMTWLPGSGRHVWEATIDGRTTRTVTRAVPTLIDANRWRFEIASVVNARMDPSRMSLSIQRIAVAGLVPTTPSTSPLAAGRLALANGELGAAATALTGAAGAEATLARAMVALRADARVAAITELGRLPREEAIATLARVARVEDGAYAAAVAEAAGDRSSEVFAFAWSTAAQHHRDASAVQRGLTQPLRGLSLDGASGSRLRWWRARANAAIGELDSAERDLAVTVEPDHYAALSPSERPLVHLERARLALVRDDVAAARAAALRALAESEWPEATADLILLDGTLAALADVPGLEQLRALGRPLAKP